MISQFFQLDKLVVEGQKTVSLEDHAYFTQSLHHYREKRLEIMEASSVRRILGKSCQLPFRQV